MLLPTSMRTRTARRIELNNHMNIRCLKNAQVTPNNNNALKPNNLAIKSF